MGHAATARSNPDYIHVLPLVHGLVEIVVDYLASLILDTAPFIKFHSNMLLLLSFLLVPSKVRELTVRKEAAGSLAYSLTWEPPASPNGIIRFYKVRMPCISLTCYPQLLPAAINVTMQLLACRMRYKS